MFTPIIDNATRKQAYAKAIADKSIDLNLLNILIDMHHVAGTLDEADADELLGLMNPVPEIPEGQG
jgi:hypothetical protein